MKQNLVTSEKYVVKTELGDGYTFYQVKFKYTKNSIFGKHVKTELDPIIFKDIEKAEQYAQYINAPAEHLGTMQYNKGYNSADIREKKLYRIFPDICDTLVNTNTKYISMYDDVRGILGEYPYQLRFLTYMTESTITNDVNIIDNGIYIFYCINKNNACISNSDCNDQLNHAYATFTTEWSKYDVHTIDEIVHEYINKLNGHINKICEIKNKNDENYRLHNIVVATTEHKVDSNNDVSLSINEQLFTEKLNDCKKSKEARTKLVADEIQRTTNYLNFLKTLL